MDLILILVIIALPLIAQSKVTSNYSKYSKIKNSINITGSEVAKKILEMNNLSNISINKIGGSLTDHYDSRNKKISLSSSIYSDNSIAAVAVAAHEVGHAIQDKENYSFLRFRNSMVPLVNFTSKAASIVIIIGFVAQATSFIEIGIGLLLVGLFFQLITLPVEFDASKRAKEALRACGMLSEQDTFGTLKVLNAAAFTYVAGFLATALQILRLVLINNRRN